MVYALLVQLLIAGLALAAKPDRVYTEGYLGERNLDAYSERYYPLVDFDVYRGRLSFTDQNFFQNYFTRYLFTEADRTGEYLKSELSGGLLCPNEVLSKHFDDIRYSYRLITLSYLIEGNWHLNLASRHFNLKRGCAFDLQQWLASCLPRSAEMKKFVERLKQYKPKYTELLPGPYDRNQWLTEYRNRQYNYYSHYRVNLACKGKCDAGNLEANFAKACTEDQNLMTLICSEADDLYGLAANRDAYDLVSGSNIINTYNDGGYAIGCLRRFSEVMAHRESRYPVLGVLFPPLKTHLQQQHRERFLQGRVFFYGSGKEFDEKGFSSMYVVEQPMKIEPLTKEKAPTPVVTAKVEAPKKAAPVTKAPAPEPAKATPAPVAKKAVKSAFLLAAEARKAEQLDVADVDMLRLKYDHVFTLNQLTTLSTQLKSFMTREALEEMFTYDKLGSKEGPVPLLFVKFMIDMQEHAGLFNLTSIVGDRFWVSNEIDKEFAPAPEFIRLTNDASTGNQWQITILKAD